MKDLKILTNVTDSEYDEMLLNSTIQYPQVTLINRVPSNTIKYNKGLYKSSYNNPDDDPVIRLLTYQGILNPEDNRDTVWESDILKMQSDALFFNVFVEALKSCTHTTSQMYDDDGFSIWSSVTNMTMLDYARNVNSVNTSTVTIPYFIYDTGQETGSEIVDQGNQVTFAKLTAGTFIKWESQGITSYSYLYRDHPIVRYCKLNGNYSPASRVMSLPYILPALKAFKFPRNAKILNQYAMYAFNRHDYIIGIDTILIPDSVEYLSLYVFYTCFATPKFSENSKLKYIAANLANYCSETLEFYNLQHYGAQAMRLYNGGYVYIHSNNLKSLGYYTISSYNIDTGTATLSRYTGANAFWTLQQGINDRSNKIGFVIYDYPILEHMGNRIFEARSAWTNALRVFPRFVFKLDQNEESISDPTSDIYKTLYSFYSLSHESVVSTTFTPIMGQWFGVRSDLSLSGDNYTEYSDSKIPSEYVYNGSHTMSYFNNFSDWWTSAMTYSPINDPNYDLTTYSYIILDDYSKYSYSANSISHYVFAGANEF